MCHSPLTRVSTAAFSHLYLQFYYISVAVKWYRVRGTECVVPTVLGAPVAQPVPTKFGTKVVIVTYPPNRSFVPILKLLASTIVLKVVSW